jgi:protein-disulfide isomerase
MKNVRSFSVLLLVITLSFIFSIVPVVQAAPEKNKKSNQQKKTLDLSGLNKLQQELMLEVFQKVKKDASTEYVRGFLEGYQVARKQFQQARKQEDPNKIYPITTMNAPVKGPKDAPVTLIEYTDYQCPFCKRVQPTIDSLLEAYPGKIRFATMCNPLPFHKNALPAALASRAARKQGKFWEMHHLLFENMKALDDASLVKYAKQLELNIEQFNKDRKDENLKKEILKEQAQAKKFGATGTPAFFVNGKKLSGARPLAQFKAAVEDALKKLKK